MRFPCQGLGLLPRVGDAGDTVFARGGDLLCAGSPSELLDLLLIVLNDEWLAFPRFQEIKKRKMTAKYRNKLGM